VPGTFVLPAGPGSPAAARARPAAAAGPASYTAPPAMPSSASLPGSWSAARRGRAELQRDRRPDGRAGSGEEHEADVLEPAADLALARRVQDDAVDRVLRQAADGQRRAPGTGRTAAAVELLHPAGRVEPQFGEGRSRMDTPDHVHLPATAQGSQCHRVSERHSMVEAAQAVQRRWRRRWRGRSGRQAPAGPAGGRLALKSPRAAYRARPRAWPRPRT
jgi:hypothetical protein